MSYYKNYLRKLSAVCKKKKLDLIEIEKVGFQREYPIYKIIINPKKQGRVVCFSAGIHGYEIAGPWAILKFLEKLNVKKLKNKLIIFPVANPTGFDKNQRLNWQKKNLNALFCRKKLIGENKILYETLEKEKVYIFHALHEDMDLKTFYLYNFEKKPEKVYRDIIKLAKKYFSIETSAKIYNDKAVDGLIINRKDGSFEDRMFREGVPYSMCTETPGKQPLKKRIEVSVKIMEKVVKFSS